MIDTKTLIVFWIGLGLMTAGFIAVYFIQKRFNDISKADIKHQRVENGPYGDARFAKDEEIRAENDMHVIDYDPRAWREGKNLPSEPGILLGDWHTKDKLGNRPRVVNKKGRVKYLGEDGGWNGAGVKSYLCTNDTHALLVASSGAGKTAYFLNPQIEYALATGISFVVTDTKGDIDRNYGKVAEEKYGYKTVLLNLRSPMRSSKFNILHMVSKYTQLYKEEMERNPSSEKALLYQARRETYAKICSKTIITNGSDGDFGQNAYFYDTAEGLLTACIMLVCEYADPSEHHIISVYKLIQALSGNAKKATGESQTAVDKLLKKLPADSKIKMFAGAAAQGGDSQASVISTAMSRLLTFIDSEIEQILCFESDIDAESFVKEKTMLILTMPEEFNTRYFMVSLVIQELYRELLTIADQYGGRVPATEGFRGKTPRVMFFLDEFGTLPKIDSAEMMFSAARSRNILFVPIVQGTVQLKRNYKDEGAAIIIDNCQLQLFTGISPRSADGKEISEKLGTYTAKGVSITHGKDNGSKTDNVVSVNLMTPEEVCTMPQGDFIVMRTGKHPMKVHFDIFLDWGIPPFETRKEKEAGSGQVVKYATISEIEQNIKIEVVEREYSKYDEMFTDMLSKKEGDVLDLF